MDEVAYDLTASSIPKCCFNGKSFYCVPGTAISTLHKFTHAILKIILYMIGQIIIPVLHIRKLSIREVKKCVRSLSIWTQILVVWLQTQAPRQYSIENNQILHFCQYDS